MQVCVKRKNGMLGVEIGGEYFPPLSFKSFRPNPTNISEFYGAGVRLFSVLSSGIICALGVPYSRFGESWIGEGEYDFGAVDRQMDMFIENAPDGYFAPMFQLDTRPWYIEKYGVPNTFTHLSQTASDEHWRRAAADYLKAVINHCEEKYGDRIYGYFLLGGMTTEWFSRHDNEEPHPIKEAGFRKWCGRPEARLPTKERFELAGDVFLSPDEADVCEARRFHSELISDTILYFAKEAQSVIKHKKLLGLYYGYLLELERGLLNQGVADYERVFLSPDIDMISSPSSYHYRKIDDPSAFMVTQRTLDKYGKLYFLEFDHITHVAPTMVHEPCEDKSGNGHMIQIPGANSKCKSSIESLNLMWRDFVLCFGKGTAMWWFDMFDGWFRSTEMMSAIRKMINIHKELSCLDKTSIAKIAVFAEGDSLYRVRKSSTVQKICLAGFNRSLAEIGAPYDVYSICDIDDLPTDQYRFIIIENSYDIPEGRLKKIEEFRKAGVKVLFLYAPNYANNGNNSVKTVSEAVGMNVTESHQSHGNLIYKGEPLPEEKLMQEAPYFNIDDKHATPLAYYEDGSCGAAKRENSYYAAVPYVHSSMLRDIAKEAGIFLYSETAKVYTYVNKNAIGIYNATNDDAVINVPEDGKYKDKISDETFMAKGGKLTLKKRDMNAFLLIKSN